MTIVQNDWIEVEYTGKLKNGEIFDTSKDKDPLKFKVGAGMVIPGFDAAVLDLDVGAKKEFTIPFKDAYGPKNIEPVEIPKTSFKDIDVLEKGKSFNFMTDMGPIKIDVVDISDDKIKAVINHPLAGEDLTFEIEIKTIFSEAQAKLFEDELANKHPGHEHTNCSETDGCDKDGCDDCDDDKSSCNC